MTSPEQTDTALARPPRLRPDELTDAQAALYRSIVGGPRRGGAFALTDAEGVLAGPFGGFLLSPEVGDALQKLGVAIRYHTDIGARTRELAILAVAAHADSAFEWYAHAAVGRTIGLTDEEMDAVRIRQLPASVPTDEAQALRLVWAVVDGDVDDETWAASTALLGLTQTYELIVLVGYYQALAQQLAALALDVVPTDAASHRAASAFPTDE